MHRHHTWNCLIIYFHDYQWQWERSWPRRCNQCIMCRCPEPGSPGCRIRIDPAPELVSLFHDATLKCLGIILEKRHEKKNQQKPHHRESGWGTWSGTLQCQNWQWSCISTHLSPGDRKPQLTHPPRWSFCLRNMDTKGSSYWSSTPICRHWSDTGPTRDSPV